MDRKEYEAKNAAEKARQNHAKAEEERAANEAELAKQRFWNHPDRIVRYTGYLAVYTSALFAATLLLFVAGVITACILYSTDEKFSRQLSITQGQLDAMEADQRPWIKIQGFPELTKVELHKSPPVTDVTLTFKATFFNVGKSPAFNFLTKAYYNISRSEDDIPNPNVKIKDDRDDMISAIDNLRRISDRSATVIFPNEPFSKELIIDAKKDMIDAVKRPLPLPPGPSMLNPGAPARWIGATTGHAKLSALFPCVYQVSDKADFLWTGYIFQIQRVGGRYFDFEFTDADLTIQNIEVVPSPIGIIAK